MIVVLLALLVGPSASAGINNTRADPWGTLEQNEGQWANGQGVLLFGNGATAAGPSPDTLNYQYNIDWSSTQTGIEWQCVELVNRLFLTHGWITSRWTGNGNQMYANAPSGLGKEAQGSVTWVNPGDVIAFSGNGTGHVGIVSTVSGSSFTLASQNTDQVYDGSFSLSSGSITFSGWTGYTAQGIIHAPGWGLAGNPLYQVTYSSGSWTKTDITATVSGTRYGVRGAPSAIWGTDKHVFVVGPSGQLLDYQLPSGASSWFPYTVSSAQVLRGGVSAVQVGSATQLFATGADGHLYQYSNSGSGWTGPYDLTYHDTGSGKWYTVQNAPSVVWGSTVNVYVAGTDGNMLQYSLPSGGSWFPYTMSTSNHTVIGGVAATHVGSAPQVFVTGTSGHLLQYSVSGGSWVKSDVTYGGITVKGDPSLMWGSTVNVFTIARGSYAGDLMQYSLPSGGSWFPYDISIAGSLAGGLSAIQDGSSIQIFGN